jgi:arylsulfatase A-like enzyme
MFVRVSIIITSIWLLVAHLSAAPNIVFVLADDLGINDLACYGRKEHNTPHLDRLAAQGMRFTSAYCAQPICSPSRAAILTGKAPARLHLTTYLPGRADTQSQKLLHPKMRQQLPLAEKTLAEYLKSAGYATACIGKWHLGGKGFLPTDQGFDVYHPGQPNTKPSETEGGKGEFDLAAKAEEFIEQNRAKPFFLYLAHNSPHIAYTARTNLIEKGKSAFEPVYAAVIETLDESVGRLLAKIDSLGLVENTIVIFTSDNGGLHVPEGGHQRVTHNRPFRAGKGFLYEGGLRIPLIVRWPGKIRANRTYNEPVINTDWTPTLLELAGVRTTDRFDGLSVVPVFAGGATFRYFFWHFPHYTNQGSSPAGAVRDGDWKLIEHYEDGRIELFNLASDPAEQRNLSAAEPARARELWFALANWRNDLAVQTNRPNPAFDPNLHAAIYKAHDVSRYDPPAADPAEFARVLEWRKRMDTAVRAHAIK